MCEHCGSMRPTYQGIVKDVAPESRRPGPERPDEPVRTCGGCDRPLERAPDGGYRCVVCDSKASPRKVRNP